jgi:hypothetical protein
MGGIIYLVDLVVVVIAVLSLLGLGQNGIRGQIMNTTNPAVPATGSYVDWPAIIAGTVVPVAINLMLTAFGATLGLSSITLEGSDKSSKLELMLTALWIILTLIVSYLAGGYIAGRMRRRIETASTDEVIVCDGINGLVVWGCGTFLSALLVSNFVGFAANTAGAAVSDAGQVAGTEVQTAGSAVGGATSGLANAAKENPTDYLSNMLLRPTQFYPNTGEPAELATQTVPN